MSEERIANLKKWAELAPGECRVESGQYGTQVWVKLGGALRFQDDPRTEIDKAIQLAALVVAIRTRGWHYSLESLPLGHEAGVWPVVRHRKLSEAPEPCDALLSAYCAALEATK